MSTLKKFAGQTAIYGVSTVVSRILNFFLTPVYTKVYTKASYGIFGYMYSWASIINAVLSFGMETTFFRYLNKNENSKEKVYNNTFITIAALSAIFLAFTLLFVDDIALWLQDGGAINRDYINYTKYFIYILVSDSMAVIPFAKLRAEGKPFRYALIKSINIGVFIALNLFFIYLVPYFIQNHLPGSTYFAGWYKGRWVGYVFLSNLLASVGTLVLLLPELLKLTFKFDRALFRDMFTYSFPVLIANISFIINENVDKVFLKKLLPHATSLAEVGVYTACCKIAVFLSIFIQAFRLGAEPFFFNHSKSKNARETYAGIMNYFVIAVAIIFVALVANIQLLKYFIDDKFWSGLDVVPILLFGYVSLGIYMNLSIWYKLSDQTRYGLYISGIGALVTVVLNLIFIPKYNYMAAAWVSLTAYVTMMVLSYLLGQKNYPIPYNLKKNVTYIVSSAIIVCLSYIVFNRNLIIGNVLLLAFTGAVLFNERKDLKQLFGTK